MALLHIAAEWGGLRQRQVLAFTVDHRLRPEAADEALHVAGVARRLGIPHATLEWSDPKPRQSSARSARHALLAGAAARAGSRLVLTAHTEDDQAETFLIRARAGSGWYGLAGIQWAAVTPAMVGEGSDTLVLRPLLGASRHSLRALLEDRGSKWIDDPSNLDRRFERVRVRELLASEPGLRARVLSCQSGLQALRSLGDRDLGQWLRTKVSAGPDGTVRAMGALPDGDQGVRALGLLVQLATMRARPLRGDAAARLVRRLSAPRPFGAATLGGAIISRPGGMIDVRAEHALDLPVVNAIPARLKALGTVYSGKP